MVEVEKRDNFNDNWKRRKYPNLVIGGGAHASVRFNIRIRKRIRPVVITKQAFKSAENFVVVQLSNLSG